MKIFYIVMGILSVFNIWSSMFLGNYRLALISTVCLMVSDIQANRKRG